MLRLVHSRHLALVTDTRQRPSRGGVRPHQPSGLRNDGDAPITRVAARAGSAVVARAATSCPLVGLDGGHDFPGAAA